MAARKRAAVRPRNADEHARGDSRVGANRLHARGLRRRGRKRDRERRRRHRHAGEPLLRFEGTAVRRSRARKRWTAPIILTPEILESDNPGEAIAAALVDLTGTEANPLDGFLIMHRSGSSRRAAEIGREQIEKHHHKTMTAALTGKLAPQRAAVVLAIVAGIQIMRQMIGLSALSKAKRKDLVQILAPLFQQLIDGAIGEGARLNVGRRFEPNGHAVRGG